MLPTDSDMEDDGELKGGGVTQIALAWVAARGLKYHVYHY